VLKPPGGGSSDIFGSGNEVDSPRRVKQNYNQSQLGSSFFGEQQQQQQQQQQHQQQHQHQQQQQQPSSNGSSGAETPRSKTGKDSHERLFGPHDDPTPNPKYHMRSNISFNNGSAEPNLPAGLANFGGSDYLINGNGYDALTGTYHQQLRINTRATPYIKQLLLFNKPRERQHMDFLSNPL
jgi:hypothetical protein